MRSYAAKLCFSVVWMYDIYSWHVVLFYILFYRSCQKTSEEEDYVLFILATLAILASRSLLLQVSVLSQPAEDGLRLHYGEQQRFYLTALAGTLGCNDGQEGRKKREERQRKRN